MASPLPSGFVPASELPPSANEEEALKELVRVQAAKIERMEQMLDEAPQSPKMPSYEKAAIIVALSALDGRIKALEQTVEHLQTELKTAQDAVKESGQEVYDVHELARYSLKTLSVRCTALEDRVKPQDTPDNRAHVEAIFQLLVSRAKTGQRGIIYSEAAKALKISKARVCQLRGLIASDCRMEISWHPNKKNTKIIHLKNYSYHNIVKLNV
jgi:hypothetical protein